MTRTDPTNIPSSPASRPAASALTAADREALKDEIRGEIRAEMRHQARWRFLRGCGCSFLSLFFTLVLPVLLLAGAAAKTGLFDVPFLTKRLYKPTAPTRVVAPLVGTTAEQILAGLSAKAKIDPATGKITLPITESELTTILSAGLLEEGQAGLPFTINSIQTAIKPDGVEVFSEIKLQERASTLALKIIPQVVGGEIKVSLADIRIGALAVPNSFVDAIVPTLMKSFNESLNKGLGGGGALQAINLREGRLELIVMAVK
ncbi:hypothetical protein A3C96_03750 [Candidatus Uhrbacteria bacterium RIFCSPHIGHO2_02_FULL_60_10]|uniref:Uncharacterized protein n=1 Tax=Candidatus Uhrbacteria bacterium RIFCSPHIGHO2_02_FULL_60_10 TaxID=1802392 RepID=A0A1F7U6E6_9BACT|nr:MAG: hypothetical protein A3C96_03750 [Candidatus Uhrbacteria bacterium RIFCSPHIGHO2_02_FULL_60_10]